MCGRVCADECVRTSVLSSLPSCLSVLVLAVQFSPSAGAVVLLASALFPGASLCSAPLAGPRAVIGLIAPLAHG